MTERPLVTAEIAHRLGVCEKTVRRLHKDGKLPGSFKLGGRTSPIKMLPTALAKLIKREDAA